MTVLEQLPEIQNKEKFKKWDSTNEAVFQILKKTKFENIRDYLNSLNEWITYNFKTIEIFFQKYPNISEEKFKKFFFTWNYNRNILMQNPEVLELFDFDTITPWTDLIEIYIKNIWLNEDEFQAKIDGMNLDILTFPWLSAHDIAQRPFHYKLSKLLKNTKIFFWDEEWIKEHYGKNEMRIDSVGFWWYMDKIPNMCVFKLLQSEPDLAKLEEVNRILDSIEEDIFIWWSSEGIPFSTKNLWVKNISLSRYSEKNWELKLNKNALENSLWYLNSSYYADKVMWAFVAKDHNLMESIHAWKATISNHLENRYNHNWLASYLWEKVWLLHFVDSSKNFAENQKDIEEFLSSSKEEIENKKTRLYSEVNGEIKKFIYWYLFNILNHNLKTRD